MRTYFVALLRFAVVLAPVGLTVLAVPTISTSLGSTITRGLFAVFVLLAVYSAFVTAGENTPGQSWFNGLQAFVDHRDTLDEVARSRVGKAKHSVKILDSYWGGIDNFRNPLKTALQRSSACQVRILLARKGGHFAAIRAAAMPDVVDVDGQIDANAKAVDGLQAFLKSVGSGLAERVSLRYFDAIVPGPLLIIDDKQVFVGSFTQAAGSPQSPALIVKKGWGRKNDAVRNYVTTFDRLWGNL